MTTQSNPLLDHFYDEAEKALGAVGDQPVRARAAYFLQAERAFVYVDCALRCLGLLPPLNETPVGHTPIDWTNPSCQRFLDLQDRYSAALAKLPEETHARFMTFDIWFARTEVHREQFSGRYDRQLGQHVGQALARNA